MGLVVGGPEWGLGGREVDSAIPRAVGVSRDVEDRQDGFRSFQGGANREGC